MIKEESFVFWITLIFYFLLIFNPNNKTLLLAFLFLFFLYFKYLKDFRLSLLLTTISSLIFSVGKTYVIELIPPNPFISFHYPSGFNTLIIIEVRDVLIALMVFVILRDIFLKKKLRLPFKLPLFFLLVYYLWIILSSLLSSKRPGLSFIFGLKAIALFVLFLYALLYQSRDKRFPSCLLSIFLSMIFFEGILVGLQLLHHHLGLSIEPTQEIELFGAGVDEDYFYYRPIGTFYHANSLAAFVLPVLFITLPFITTLTLRLALITGFLILLFSLSRSAWLSFALGILLFLYVVEKHWQTMLVKLKLRSIRKFLNLKTIFLSIIAFIIASLTVFPRAIKTFYTFEETGGGWTRILLAKEALNLISQYPIFGVGLGMGPVEVFAYDPQAVATHFFSGVHNGFLAIALESGLVGLFLFLLFFYFSLKRLIERLDKLGPKKKIIALGGIIGIISLMTNAIFQPFFNLEVIMLIIVFVISLGYNLS